MKSRSTVSTPEMFFRPREVPGGFLVGRFRASCLASGLLLVLGLCLAAPAQDPELPLDGEVFHVGDPVVIEPAEYCGCSQTPDRVLQHWSGPLTEEYFAVVSADLTTETVGFNVPGDYELVQRCLCLSPFCPPGCLGGEFRSHFTVVDSCLEEPPATAPDPGEPQPEIEVSVYRPDGFNPSNGISGFLTLDNSIAQFLPLKIKNSGEDSLVLKNVYTAFQFQAYELLFPRLAPHTVINPGQEYLLMISGRVLDSENIISRGGTDNAIVLSSNDPEESIYIFKFSDIPVFSTLSEVPPESIYSGEYPSNPIPPDCADTNGDGVIDAADTIQILLGE